MGFFWASLVGLFWPNTIQTTFEGWGLVPQVTAEDRRVFTTFHMPSDGFHIWLSSYLKLCFPVHAECSALEFRCKNGQCISNSLRCDGNRDCVDHSDEDGCPGAWPLRCPLGEVKCRGSGECVPATWLCDRDFDCEDGTDEQVAHPSSEKLISPHNRNMCLPYRKCEKTQEQRRLSSLLPRKPLVMTTKCPE